MLQVVSLLPSPPVSRPPKKLLAYLASPAGASYLT
jgi:hypothetical protein